jgi:hypothetical protein
MRSPVSLGSDSVGFFLNLSSTDGQHGGQASVRYTNGEQSSFSTFSFADAQNKELDRKAEVSGSSVIASFPMENLADYGLPFRYSGATTLDGEDVDACPNDDKRTGDTAYRVFTGS